MVIVVLGACGFIGSHLVEALLKQRGMTDIIVAVASYRSDGKMGWLDTIPEQEGLKKRRGDITDSVFLRSLAPNRADTTIYNLAAQISVPGSLSLPERYWETNATAVLKLLTLYDEARIIQISTSEVFAGQSSAGEPYQLDSKPDPVSWYGASKAASEMLVRASNNPEHIFVRLFNTYGPRQFPRAVVPYMIRQAIEIRDGKRTIAEFGDPNASRGFHYVEDIAEALTYLARGTLRGHMQWATKSPMTISMLWDLIAVITGVDQRNVKWDLAQRPERVKVQALFGEKSHNLPEPCQAALWKTKMLEGLSRTYAWIQANPGYAAEGYYQ